MKKQDIPIFIFLNVENGKKKDLTPGDYEVFDPIISNDEKHWYFTSSKVHPGERHFYKMPLMGGKDGATYLHDRK